jgi:hypothetical protein
LLLDSQFAIADMTLAGLCRMRNTYNCTKGDGDRKSCH